ncbi:hypothetical protein ACFLTE_05560 [Bacteroidota bacterium]
MNKVLLIFFLVLGVFACNKDESPLLLFVTPVETYYYVEPLDVLSFTINSSGENNLKKLQINSRVKNSYTYNILDTSLSGSTFSMKFEYMVPQLIDEKVIFLEFILYDVDDNMMQAAKIIELKYDDKLLTETAGHEMFSALSGKQDGYDLNNGEPLYSAFSDSSTIHIMDVSNDTANTDSLLRKWMSPAGLNFVRFNDFDYANCTYLTMKNSYEAGIQKDFIDKLQEGDILLTKLPAFLDSANQTLIDSAYFAIKIINIIDNNGTEFDRYIFNIKK